MNSTSKKSKESRTTVHYWDKDGKKGEYSFKDKPDLDRIYKETIGEGQLAAWVNIGCYVHVFVSSSVPFSSGEWYEKNWYIDEVYLGLDQAVQSYVVEQKQDKWTYQVGELKVRAYENNAGNIFLKWSDGKDRDIIETVCMIFNLPIMMHDENKGEFKCPE